MRQIFLGLAALMLLSAIGCAHNQANNCNNCNNGRHANLHSLMGQADRVPKVPHGAYRQDGPPGPPSASYAYPYYTLRAPRDFLRDNPPTIGP